MPALFWERIWQYFGHIVHTLVHVVDISLRFQPKRQVLCNGKRQSFTKLITTTIHGVCCCRTTVQHHQHPIIQMTRQYPALVRSCWINWEVWCETKYSTVKRSFCRNFTAVSTPNSYHSSHLQNSHITEILSHQTAGTSPTALYIWILFLVLIGVRFSLFFLSFNPVL